MCDVTDFKLDFKPRRLGSRRRTNLYFYPRLAMKNNSAYGPAEQSSTHFRERKNRPSIDRALSQQPKPRPAVHVWRKRPSPDTYDQNVPNGPHAATREHKRQHVKTQRCHAKATPHCRAGYEFKTTSNPRLALAPEKFTKEHLRIQPGHYLPTATFVRNCETILSIDTK